MRFTRKTALAETLVDYISRTSYYAICHSSAILLLAFCFAPPCTAAGENPFTPKAYVIRYWDKQIPNGLPKPAFLLDKASPLTTADYAAFFRLSDDHNSLSTQLPEFCSKAHLLCFPDLAPSREKHSQDVNFANYLFDKFTNYGTRRGGGVDSFTQYVAEDTFRRYSRGSTDHRDRFTVYENDSSVIDDRFNTYGAAATGGKGEFNNYNTKVNVPGARFTSYSDSSAARKQSFILYANQENAGDNSFTSYGKKGNDSDNEFKSFGDAANAIASTFANYGESGNSPRDTFTSYGDKISNIPRHTFTSYGPESRNPNDTFTTYGSNANVAENNFKNKVVNQTPSKLELGWAFSYKFSRDVFRCLRFSYP